LGGAFTRISAALAANDVTNSPDKAAVACNSLRMSSPLACELVYVGDLAPASVAN
jgi:expansin (peptidoglycan-binding protein)